VHRWIERPLLTDTPGRSVAWATDRRVVLGSVSAMIVVATAITLTAPPPRDRDYDFARAERRANADPGTNAGDDRPAVALFGGSTSVSLGAVAFDWAADSQRLRVVAGSSQLGCGVVTEGRRVTPTSHGGPAVQPPDDHCRDWPSRWQTALGADNVSLAVMFGGVWETTDWLLDGADQPTDITDPAFARLVHTRLTEAADILSADGRRALLATTPLVGPGRSGQVPEERGLGVHQRQRVDTYNELVRDVAAHNEKVDVLDYATYIDSLDPATNVEWLPDGIHPTATAALAIWDGFLGHAVIERLPPASPTFIAGPPETGPPEPGPPEPGRPVADPPPEAPVMSGEAPGDTPPEAVGTGTRREQGES
jgi:hypothetical protein